MLAFFGCVPTHATERQHSIGVVHKHTSIKHTLHDITHSVRKHAVLTTISIATLW